MTYEKGNNLMDERWIVLNGLLNEVQGELITRKIGSTIGAPCGRCETGEEYLCLMSGGFKRPGEDAPAYYREEERAIKEWKRTFWEYADRKVGRLYWRDPPMLSITDPGATVYSRLIITDRPELSEAEQIERGIKLVEPRQPLTSAMPATRADQQPARL